MKPFAPAILAEDRPDCPSHSAVVHAHPRSDRFKEEIIQAFYDAIHPRPETTFGNVKADVLADKDHSFRPENFCRVIRASAWPG